MRDHFSHGKKIPPPLLGKSAAGITHGPMGGVRERPYITFYASTHTHSRIYKERERIWQQPLSQSI